MKKAFVLIIVLSLFAVLVFGQVPAILDPKSLSFEKYTGIVVSPNTGASPLAPTNNGAPMVSPTVPVNQRYNVPPAWATSQQQLAYADEDLRRHESVKRAQQEALREINALFESIHIDYEFPVVNSSEKKIYSQAFEELSKMLNGKTPPSIKYSVYLVEHAFDPSINWSDYNAQLQQAASTIGLDMKSRGTSPSDNTAKIMSTFRYMTDTISVYSGSRERRITSYPKSYDFEDFWGQGDYRKMFVSKLMSKGSGQCHSLPLLFLILCEEIGAKANLAFAPNHSFVKFQDKRGVWHNLELTNGMLASDHFMMESGFIKAEAIQNRIYLEPLSQQQTIVQCLNDLALGYIKKFGYDAFVKNCVDVALSFDPNSLTAQQIRANYFATLSEYVLFQYQTKGLNRDNLKNDHKALEIFESASSATRSVENLGYSEMPPEIYEAWLKSIQKEANKQLHAKEIKILGGLD